MVNGFEKSEKCGLYVFNPRSSSFDFIDCWQTNLSALLPPPDWKVDLENRQKDGEEENKQISNETFQQILLYPASSDGIPLIRSGAYKCSIWKELRLR